MPETFHFPVREDWLDTTREEALDPARLIIDPHHHLWDRPGWRYLLPEFLADTNDGHNIVGSVYVQARSMHRANGPDELKPVGETEFANGVAALSASGRYGSARICAGIVGRADLTIGARVQDVLDAHTRVAGPRFVGIRYSTARDDDPSLINPGYHPPPGQLADRVFREGFARLGKSRLTFDGWVYHPQLAEVTDLARAFPETTVVLDHLGGPTNAGVYSGRDVEMFAQWRSALPALAACPNIVVKLGGLGMRTSGANFHTAARAPSSVALADAFRPYFETCIDAFGTKRCMFESNFPVDKGSFSYQVFWNACKRISGSFSEDEKDDLFRRTAMTTYRMSVPA